MMADNRSFADGYINGWQSVMGRATVPAIPAYAVPAGMTEFEAGYQRGVEAATERRAWDQKLSR
jgi:hypothetical protein